MIGVALIENKIYGSYMPLSSEYIYWPDYYDRYSRVLLMAEPGVDRVVATSNHLNNFVKPMGSINKMIPYSFYPLSLGAGVKNAVVISATMTGGRTFLLSRASSRMLGFPAELWLDLSRLGWGNGLLEVRVEVKGGGTLFERTRLDPGKLSEILRNHPELEEQHLKVMARKRFPLLLASRAEFMGRHRGGQSQRFAAHAVQASNALLDKSLIKFIPVWSAVSQSDQVHRNLDVVSEALASDETLFAGNSVCEVRLTPSTVRALYFDTARNQTELRVLCSFVSQENEELIATLDQMIQDARRYLEILAKTTRAAVIGDGFTWIKVSDINEVFSQTEADDFRSQRPSAWFFAKDEVIVRKVGKFFTDMESYFGKDVGYHSLSEASLRLHHSLYVLSVLRDHLRVCAQFAIGTEALRTERELSTIEERSLRRKVLMEIIAAINASQFLHLSRSEERFILKVRYEHLNNQYINYEIRLDQLHEL
jgi:hypothetical protein